MKTEPPTYGAGGARRRFESRDSSSPGSSRRGFCSLLGLTSLERHTHTHTRTSVRTTQSLSLQIYTTHHDQAHLCEINDKTTKHIYVRSMTRGGCSSSRSMSITTRFANRSCSWATSRLCFREGAQKGNAVSKVTESSTNDSEG